MPKEEVKEEVKEIVDASSSTTKEVTSPEVKTEVTSEVTPEVIPEKGKDDGVEKMQKQISNLNIAIKQEREEGKTKLADLSSKLENANAFSDRLKQAINPEELKSEEPTYSTKEEMETIIDAKMLELKQEASDNQKIEVYKTQIKNLESKWDGKDGKPVYKDEEILKWQQTNDKNYLSPEDAFNQMKHSEIIDYEVKQKIAGRKPVETVEQPSKTPTEHVAPDVEENIKLDTRAAALEAMENADKEM